MFNFVGKLEAFQWRERRTLRRSKFLSYFKKKNSNFRNLVTVKSRYTGPESNENPPITNSMLYFLKDITFNFLSWQ